VIIGQDNTNVPNVIKLFADAFAKSSIEVNSVVGQRMILIIKHVQVKFLLNYSNFFFTFFLFRQFHQYFKHV
jgi:hypothetical protein